MHFTIPPLPFEWASHEDEECVNTTSALQTRLVEPSALGRAYRQAIGVRVIVPGRMKMNWSYAPVRTDLDRQVSHFGQSQRPFGCFTSSVRRCARKHLQSDCSEMEELSFGSVLHSPLYGDFLRGRKNSKRRKYESTSCALILRLCLRLRKKIPAMAPSTCTMLES